MREIKAKTKEKLIKTNKGITLIALVITIVVLIILAGISIGALTGNNGIINQTQNAKEQTEIADEKERIDLSTVGAVGKEPRGELKRNYFNDELTEHIGKEGKDYSLSESENAPFIVEYLDSKRSYLVDEDGNITGPLIAPEETEEPDEGGTEFIMTTGVIEIKWLMGDTNFVSETANAPVIKTDIPNTTMKLVKYENGNWVEGTDYDYKAGKGTEDNRESRWANAEVEIDYGEGNQKIKSYFVWIPRYAYRIIYFNNNDSKTEYLNEEITEDEAIKEGKIIGYSDSRGIVSIDTEGTVKKVSGTTSLNIGGNYFRVHPAFIDDSKNNYENGGWDEELPGIWVGKYESSKSDATSSYTGNDETTIKIQPGVRSLIRGTIAELYDHGKAYSINLNSHMLKNSEWGAIVYLTESKYGRNGTEVTINNNSNDITGSAQTTSGTTDDYKSTEGVLASSTGNVTGIYDLVGGNFEAIAAYLQNEYTQTENSLVNETNKKFVAEYKGDDETTDYKSGDATYETKNWHDDNGEFFANTYQLLFRGGRPNNAHYAGIFYYHNLSNDYDDYIDSSSPRICLAIK